MSNILTNNINPRSGNLITIGGANDRVSIAGTLTYEDVANIDSVGIITAQAGIRVSAGSSIGIGAPNPDTLLNVEGNDTTVYSSTNIPFQSPCNVVIRNNDTSVLGTYAGLAFRVYGNNGNATRGSIGIVKTTAGGSNGAMTFGMRGSSYGNIVERMRLTSDGNIGIGTDNPSQQKLTIDVDSSGTSQASFNGINIANTDTTANNGSAIIFGQSIAGNSNARIGAINSDRSGGSEDQEIFFGTLGAGVYAERMRIDGSGRVTIKNSGSNEASEFQSAANQFVITNNDACGLTIDATSSTNCSIHFADGTTGNESFRGFFVYNNSDDSLRIGTAGAERMQINAEGLVGINQTNPNRQLHVVDSRSSFATAAFENTNSSATTGTAIFADYYAPNTSSFVFLQFNADQGGTPEAVFVINGVGDVTNKNNSYGPIASDQRLKQDIVDVSSQWDDIKAVRLTKFHYKDDPTGELQIGPIAQELETVCPNLITRRSASKEEIEEPSNDLTEGDEVLSFKASVLQMKAFKALQEAMARIEALEQRLTDAGL